MDLAIDVLPIDAAPVLDAGDELSPGDEPAHGYPVAPPDVPAAPAPKRATRAPRAKAKSKARPSPPEAEPVAEPVVEPVVEPEAPAPATVDVASADAAPRRGRPARVRQPTQRAVRQPAQPAEAPETVVPPPPAPLLDEHTFEAMLDRYLSRSQQARQQQRDARYREFNLW